MATFLAVAPEPDNGITLAAKFDGELALTDSGCFGLGSEGVVHAAVFPFGTVIQADGAGITVPDVGDIDLGDAFTAAGGIFSPDNTTSWIPEQCLEEQMPSLYPL